MLRSARPDVIGESFQPASRLFPWARFIGRLIGDLSAARNGKPEKHTAVVQVKGGHVTADSVRALDTVVRRSGSMAGIMVCFANQMRTVDNQSGTEVWADDYRTYPVIQGLSVEDLLTGQRPNMPPLYGARRGGQISMF